MSRRCKVRTRLKASLFSRQKQLLSFKVLKGISLVGTNAHPRDIHGSKIGIYLGISHNLRYMSWIFLCRLGEDESNVWYSMGFWLVKPLRELLVSLMPAFSYFSKPFFDSSVSLGIQISDCQGKSGVDEEKQLKNLVV